MAKLYEVTIWYSVPKWACFDIKADSEEEARRIAESKLMDEDTSTWNDASDAEITFDIEGPFDGILNVVMKDGEIVSEEFIKGDDA